MSNKVKLISIILLTIVMAIGVKFGKVDEQYFIDVEVNKYYSEIWNCITEGEELAQTNNLVKLQDKVLEGRKYITDLEEHIKDNYTEDYKKDIVSWSLRFDALQQVVLRAVNEKVEVAVQLKNEKDIDEARTFIPKNLPDKWKQEINGTLDNIEVYEGVSNELYTKAKDTFESILKTSREKELEIPMVQEDINVARKKLKDLTEYIYNNDIQFYRRELGEWSVRLDKLQQIVINRVNELVTEVEKTKDKEEISKIKQSIKDIPEKFSKEFTDRLSKIK